MRIRKNDLDQMIYEIHLSGLNPTTREIYLHSYFKGDEDAEPGIDYRSSATFIKNLHVLEKTNQDNILVHLHNQEGGDYGYGMAIYDAITMAKSPITMLAYAGAVSMTAIIFQAAKRRVMTPNCYMMIHYGFISIDSTSQAATELIKINESWCNRFIELLAKRAMKGSFFKGKTESYVKSYLNREIRSKSDWYLTCEEAVDMGLADGILGTRGFQDMDSIRL